MDSSADVGGVAVPRGTQSRLIHAVHLGDDPLASFLGQHSTRDVPALSKPEPTLERLARKFRVRFGFPHHVGHTQQRTHYADPARGSRGRRGSCLPSPSPTTPDSPQTKQLSSRTVDAVETLRASAR